MNYNQILARAMNQTLALVHGDADSNTLFLRGVFLPDDYANYRGAITMGAVEQELEEMGLSQGDDLRIVIDSVGGDVSVSQWMMHEISAYNTTVEARARLYSAATHMAMGAQTIVGAEGSDYLIHYPWTFAAGNAKAFRQYAEELDGTGNALIKQYMRRMNLNEQDLRSLMDEERIITDERALEIGLIDKIIPLAEAEAYPRAQGKRGAPEPTAKGLGIPQAQDDDITPHDLRAWHSSLVH